MVNFLNHFHGCSCQSELFPRSIVSSRGKPLGLGSADPRVLTAAVLFWHRSCRGPRRLLLASLSEGLAAPGHLQSYSLRDAGFPASLTARSQSWFSPVQEADSNLP